MVSLGAGDEGVQPSDPARADFFACLLGTHRVCLRASVDFAQARAGDFYRKLRSADNYSHDVGIVTRADQDKGSVERIMDAAATDCTGHLAAMFTIALRSNESGTLRRPPSASPSNGVLYRPPVRSFDDGWWLIRPTRGQPAFFASRRPPQHWARQARGDPGHSAKFGINLFSQSADLFTHFAVYLLEL